MNHHWRYYNLLFQFTVFYNLPLSINSLLFKAVLLVFIKSAVYTSVFSIILLVQFSSDSGVIALSRGFYANKSDRTSNSPDLDDLSVQEWTCHHKEQPLVLIIYPKRLWYEPGCEVW